MINRRTCSNGRRASIPSAFPTCQLIRQPRRADCLAADAMVRSMRKFDSLCDRGLSNNSSDQLAYSLSSGRLFSPRRRPSLDRHALGTEETWQNVPDNPV
jgi:hypothetical protein